MTKITLSEVGGVQGDVPIIKIAALPKGATPTQNRTVALGETTGHHHTISGGTCYEADTEIGGKLFSGTVVVVGDEPATMIHNSNGEHYAVEMTRGIWFVPAPDVQQVEYDGANERRARD